MNKEFILSIDGEQIAAYDETETAEESIYSNIKDEAANLPEAIQLAWQGWLGIFIVAIVIIAVTSLLNAVTSKRGKKVEL